MKLRFPLFVALGVFASACGDDSSLKGVVAESVNLDNGGTGVASDCETTPAAEGRVPTGQTGVPTGAPTTSTTTTTTTTTTTSSPGGGTGRVLPPTSPECVGQANGTVCGAMLICMHERCQPSYCGDGFADPHGFEECDDGNEEVQDGCNICLVERCGDGVINKGEECDDGNNIREDGCDIDCKRTSVSTCGNAKLDPGEQCDDGNTENFEDPCRNDCRLAPGPACGNGKVDNGEQCDDGNHLENDGCSPNCQLEACGDGFVRAMNEQCDDGNTEDGDGCSAKCKVEIAVCGNGVVEGEETCDDGNNRNTDDCPNDCKLAECGDGTVEGIETCDDGNTETGDGCDDKCQQEVECGNGIVETVVRPEQCDDGNKDNFDRCPSDCQLPVCGDGVHEGAWEECDDGNSVAGDGCDKKCRIEPICGNGIKEASVHYPELSEFCDDGNTVDGDECPADCKEPALADCGDGKVDTEAGEQCDPGATSTPQERNACVNCKWAFFNEECSRCVAEFGHGASTGGTAFSDIHCDAVRTDLPCFQVLDCFVKNRCSETVKKPNAPNPIGPFACVCGELGVGACQNTPDNDPLPGVCYEVAKEFSYKFTSEEKVLASGQQEFFARFARFTTPMGKAVQSVLNMSRPQCRAACADYVQATPE